MNSNKNRFQIISFSLVLVVITIVFLVMIRSFLVALFLAAIFSAFAAPLYRKFLGKTGGRSGWATTLTLVVLYAGVLTPTAWIFYIAAGQASGLADSVVDLVQTIDANEYSVRAPEWLPYSEDLEAAGAEIVSKVGELVGEAARYLVSAVSSATKGTASFLLSLFIMTYAMVYFLKEETDVVTQLMRFTGLPDDVQERMSNTVMSVSGATLKGTVIISIIQGIVGGVGFYFAGIEGAAFFGVMMALLSMIPGIGPTLVWVPIAIYLLATGNTTTALLLAAYCSIILTIIDNVLSPALVGQDTELSGLMVLVSTLGGISMFGVVGFIIGPVIAGLLIAVWDTYSAYLFGESSAEGGGGLTKPPNQ